MSVSPVGLDPALNRFPENIGHIHLMGICGTGVGALAGMLKNAGFTVTGSDQQVYPPMSDFLAGQNIGVQSGYSPDNLEPRPDLVVVGNVIRRDNPEALALAERGIPYVSFPQALSHFFIRDKTSLVVAGTHGKTTTSSLLASLLREIGAEPSFMIGGLVQAFGRNFNVTAGKYFVAEGDEYDTAFFDKGPKFLHYRPRIAILTSIEFDHADIYADLAAIKVSFAKLVASMPADGFLVACWDDPVVREVCQGATCTVVGYGSSDGCDWRITDLSVRPAATSFQVDRHGVSFGVFENVLPGRHNALNALAVIAVLDILGFAREDVARGLRKFQGVRRRQEVRGVARGVTVIDDFAHHPTAVRETLGALAAAYAGHRLVAVFEPRTNSSRRKVFQEAYASAFDAAAEVLVREPAPLANIPEGDRFSSRRLVEDLVGRGLCSRYFSTTEDVLSYLDGSVREGDVVAIMSNGGFDNIHQRLLELLSQAAAGPM
ncbi:MAG: UDP-N-acetylmuramate--L-alanine ligase [Desulfurivibrionaceae bacterium]